MWDLNYQQPHILAYIGLALRKAGYSSSEITLRPHTKGSVQEAFDALRVKEYGLDLIVAGIDQVREKTYLPLYVPLERGLLGFRICLTHPDNHLDFKKINRVSDFKIHNMNVGLVRGWPDVDIMKSNGIPVSESLTYQEVINQLLTRQVDCFSRSVIEAKTEVRHFKELIIESRIALVYPFADIMYVNPNNPELWQQLQSGFEKAIEDEDFFQIYQQYYGDFLEKNLFYDRKLLIMDNPDVSAEALEAINRLGIASFNKPNVK